MSDEHEVNSSVGLIERVPSRCLDGVDCDVVAGISPDQVSSMGRRTTSEVIWTKDELNSAFDGDCFPCWVSRTMPGKAHLREVIFANAAAKRRFGEPYTSEQTQQVYELCDSDFKSGLQDIILNVHDKVQETRRTLRVSLSLAKVMQVNFPSVSTSLYGCVRTQALTISYDGQMQPAVMATLEREIDATDLRSSAVARYTPIHSFLFSATGQVLFANNRALSRLRNYGLATAPGFDLASLLINDGAPQPELANQAIAAIITRREPHYRVTLGSHQPDGAMRHTLYEMWPARDPVDALSPAIVVSAFDVTHLTEAELELEGMKQALQQHNADLQEQVQQISHGKAGVELERQALQTQLKAALQLHMLPRTSIKPLSPLDKTLTLLDMLLEGDQPSQEQIVQLKAALLHNDDLRQPDNLQEQLMNVSGLNEDANKSLMLLLQDTSHAVKRIGNSKLVASVTGTNGRWHVDTNFSSPWIPVKTSERRASVETLPPPADAATAESWWIMQQRGIPVQTELCKPITPIVERLLQEASRSWTFNMFELDEATDHHALSCYAYFCWQQSGLSDHFIMHEDNWTSFLRRLEAGYRQNHYHNHVHAACVLHMVDLLTRQPDGLMQAGIIEHLLLAALYIGAICHDYDHPAVANDFLIKTSDPLAILYNDNAPLENHHTAASFKLLYELPVVRLMNTPMEDRQITRATVTELIMGTDLKQHFTLMSRLQAAVQSGAYERTKSTPSASGQIEQPRMASMTAEHRMTALLAAVKCADLGHWALPSHLHQEWVNRLQSEFLDQGDRERALGLPVSPLMDREKPSSMANSQVGFFEVIVKPLFLQTAAVIPAAQHMLDAAMKNYYWWRMQQSSAQTA